MLRPGGLVTWVLMPPICLWELATLFTGQDPLRHGLLRNGEPLPDSAATLAEAFRDAGYHTAAFVSSFVLSRRFGFDQGFASFDDAFDRETSTFSEKYWEGLAIEGNSIAPDFAADYAAIFLDGAS